jgi:hypothetical protein
MKSRRKFKVWLKERVSFRLHMTFLLTSTVIMGIICNFLLLNFLSLKHPGMRYPLSVALSYCWFLFSVRIYIRNILPPTYQNSQVDLDLSSVDMFLPDSDQSSFEDRPFSGGEFNIDGSLDLDDGGVVILLGTVIMAVIFGSGVYLIWHSPEILSECLLQVMLVSGMRKGMKRGDWFKHLFKSTIFAFTIVFLLSIGLGLALRAVGPEVNGLKDYQMKSQE